MDQQQRADLYEPSPRFTHVAASVSDVSTSQLVIVWGGQTAESYSRDGRTQLPSCCQLFHIQSEVWSERHAVLGPPHPGLSTAACTSFEDYLFIYGGFVYNDSGLLVFSGELSCLNIKTLTWSQLCPAGTAGGPMRKASCGMVLVDSDKLAVIGGYGFPTGPTQPGSSFIIDTKFTDGRGWTSEVHVFDLSQGVWFSPPIRGSRPPPCTDFTLTSIDNHQAVLFGGYQPGRGHVSDLYLIDFESNTMAITKLEPCEGEPWPVGRDLHAACCLEYAGDHIHLLVTGGTDRDNKTLKDLWLFDLSLKKWKEVTLPEGSLQRWGHSTTAIILCPGLVEVTVFGGCPDDYDPERPEKDDPRIAETTIITFIQVGSEWEVVGVANNSQQGTSERVREKMLLRSGTDTQGPQISFDLESEVTPYALYRLERGGIRVRSQISSRNKDFQAILRVKQPDAGTAMIKWINSVHQTSLKPTWKTLLLVLRLINLDHLAEEINTYLSEGIVKQLSEGTSSSKEQDGSLSEVFTFAALTQLEKREGIPVLTELEATNKEFQAVIRVKQPDISQAIDRWLTTPVRSRVKPTWGNLLCVLRLINLDQLANDIELYLKGGDIEKLRNELLTLCDKLKEGDLDENVRHLRYKIENFSKLAIEQMKENAESKEAVVDIKRRLPSPAPPQPERVENADRAKKEPGSPSGTTPAEESDLTMHTVKKERLTKDLMSVYTAVAKTDVSTEILDMLRSKVLEMKDQLALVQRLGEIVTDSEPTSTQLTSTAAPMATQPLVHVKEEPLEEALTSTADYSTIDAGAVKTETKMESQALGALVQPPGVIMETSLTPPQLTGGGLRGVEVCGETTVVVTNGPQSFSWEGYGLKLHIPQGCLPAGMEQCTINIKVSLAGQYEFPENTHPVSAVFWLRCEPRCKFVVPVSVEIQHCARPENITKLSFVKAVCSQESLPYTFRRQQGGRFTSSSFYGVLELESFSGAGVTQEGSEDREYIARLFYQNQTARSCDIHLVVTWNIEAYLTIVKKEYHQAHPGPHQPIDFESDQIKLDIPVGGVSLQGWRIIPLTAPVVTKKYVDSYQPGKWIPSCQLLANCEHDSTEVKVVPFLYQLKLLGAKEPHNIFTIVPPLSRVQHSTEHLSASPSVSLPAKRSHTPPSTIGPSQKKLKPSDSEPTNKDVPAKPELSDLMRELCTKAADKWENIGILLRIDDGQLKVIKSNNPSDSIACLREMLRIWLARVDPRPSWSAIAEAIKLLGDESLADNLRSKYNCN